MQIHELNNFVGQLGSGAFLAVDDGADTGKLSTEALLAGVNDAIDQLDNDLNGRIDNIIAGGDAPSEAEIIDARRGANGVNYTSLGSAIRSQFNNVNDDINEMFEPYEWLDGYYMLGNGTFVSQTGTVTYHSTDKINGTEIPDDNDFINSAYLYLSDSFFALWKGNTYVGYLMNNVWYNPSGTARQTPQTFTKYAIVLHNVENYEGFGRRKYAFIEEVADGVRADKKASMLVDTITFDNDDYVTYPTVTNYAYKCTKKVHIASLLPYVPSGATVYAYILRHQPDDTYTTDKSHTFADSTVWNVDTDLNIDDAILLGYTGLSPATQYFSATNANDYFSVNFGWNNNTHKLVNSTLGYYIPAEIVLYDPISNYLLNYIDNGNPCNWKGSECSVFDNLLCIGDSITQGAPTPPNITPDPNKATRIVTNATMYSYPASMKKQWGVDCTNWGKSGVTSQGWYDYYSVNEPSWSGHDGAVILIGDNDYHLVDDLGGLTEETLPTAIARSKAAMMSIITKLKADNADIKIFICTLLPGWDNATSLAPYVCDNIRDIANDEDNVYLIDLSKYSKIAHSSPYSYIHPTAIGYNQMAREIGGAIGYTIVNNPGDFKWIQFIGTEYAMD